MALVGPPTRAAPHDMTTHAQSRRAALYLLAPSKALRLDVREILREEQRRGRRADRQRVVAR